MSRYPFKFLNAYDRSDTDIFFGREEEVDQLYQMAFQTDLLLVYGASGTGKTSVIDCGLANRFEPHDWLALKVRRGANLNQSFRAALQAADQSQAPSEEDLSWLDELDEADEARAEDSDLARQFKALYRQYFRPIYLIFDQFEELYILGGEAEQRQFIDTVQEILRLEQPIKLIFIIREEYLGHLFDFERAVPQLLRKKLRIEPMNLDKVRQVIEGVTQARDSNVHLQAGEEAAIAEEIFAKIKGEEKALAIQLPYLQVFLDKLYLQVSGDESRQAEATFSLAALRQIGDIGDVLRDFLEEQAQRIQAQLAQGHTGLPEDAVWQVLSPFATLEGTKEPLSLAELQQRLPQLPPAVIEQALQALNTSRIMRYDEGQGLYEIAHDSLALRLAERRSDEEIALLEIRRLLKSQTLLQAEARELFSDKQLNFMEPYLDRLALTEEEEQLLADSRAAVAQRKEAERQQAEAERQALLERQRLLERNQKTQRRFIAVLGVVLLGMAVLVWWALQQRQEANDNAQIAADNAKKFENQLLANQKQQALNTAAELAAYGDSYADLNKLDYACDSYRAARDSLTAYPDEALYQELADKINQLCP